jgi:hypothetical protein
MTPRSRLRSRRPIARLLILVAVAATACVALPSGASAATNSRWLCKPGKEPNPCKRGLRTTLISPTGEKLGTKDPKTHGRRKVDCFYVYPTVSDQQTKNANLHIDPEERSIALYQAARYSQYCRVYAPMYRQVTLAALFNGGFTPHETQVAYDSVLNAWNKYVAKFNDGRGIVFIGHSQGTFMLRALLANEVDPNPQLRDQMVSAILLGGDVTVADGSNVGGDFQNIPACSSPTEISCVMAFSTYNETPPDDSVFGRTTVPGDHVLCTNPAALGGGSADLRTVYPSKPFAPGTSIGAATRLVGFPVVDASTRWLEADGAYNGHCSSANGADVLEISGNDGAPTLRPVPNAAWGLHLTDANIALGNLVTTVRHEISTYRSRH